MPRTIERFGAPASHSGARTRAASQDDLAAAAWNRRDWRSGCASGFGSGRSTGVAIHRTVQTVARVVDGTMYFRKAGWILMYCNFLQTGKPLVSTDSPFNVPGHACRPGCGACCIAPSITTPIPGMPHGKPAGVRCIQLSDDMRCRIFGSPERPACCSGLNPQVEMCGESRGAALTWLANLEAQTRP